MTQATPYTRTTGFADDERNNAGGRSTVRTAQVDAELDSIAVSLNLTIKNLALLQRDDTVMRDGVVPVSALGSDTLKLLTTGSAVVRGAWLTATAYAIKDLVTQSGNTYICAVAHTAGVFATDLAAVKWILFQIGANPTAGSIPFSPTVNTTSTNVQAAIVEVDSDLRAVVTAQSATDNAAMTAAVALVRSDLADSTDATHGDFLVATKRTNVANAVALTLHDWVNSQRVNVLEVGCKGDGTTDDLAKLNTLSALGIPLYMPYTSTGYRVSGSWSVQSDVYCDGYIVPDLIGALPVIIVVDAPFGITRILHGVRIWGSAAHQAAGLFGFRIDCSGAHLTNCVVFELARGYIVRMFSVTLTSCSSANCTLPNSAYARDSSHEINCLHIDGGRYSGSNGVSWNIGDTSWTDALGHGAANGTSISHGVVVCIDGGASFDGGSVDVDNISLLTGKGIYFENSPTNGCGFRLGTLNFDGNLRNVDIDNVFFKNMKWATKCFAAVNGVEIGRCFYTAITHSALHITSDLYHVLYTTGDATASFTQGQEFHSGFRSLSVGSVTFGNQTVPHLGLARGVQELIADVGAWYPGGQLKTSSSVATMNASSACRFYTTPALTKAGTVASGVFTFTTLADCYAFNGGDALVTAPAGATYIRSVDYEAGTMVIDGGVTANGAATVSQKASAFETKYTGAGAPSGGLGGNNDFYFRTDGTAGNAIYQKRAGSWAAVA